MLKVPEVAERLNCSIATVYSLIEKGDLAAVKIGAGGGGVRVLDADLQAFIESRRISSPPPAPVNVPRPRLKHVSF